MRRLFPSLLVLLAAVTMFVAPPPAGADLATTKAERERVRTERAQAAVRIDVLRADRNDITTALRDLDVEVRGQERALGDAQDELDAAEAARVRAQKGIRSARTRLARLRAQMVRQAIEAYTSPAEDPLGVVLESSDPSEAVRRQAIVKAGTDRDADITDRVRAAQNDLEAQRRAAAAAATRARAKKAEVSDRLAKVKRARAQKADLARRVQQRVNAEVARAIRLGTRDRTLSRQILREQAAIQARLAADRAERIRRQREADRAAAVRANAPPPPAPVNPPVDDDGNESAPLAPTPAPAVSPGGTGSGGVSLCFVAGDSINCQIAEQVRSMVAAAAADGVGIAINSGYRDPAQQIALRRQNCGSSEDAIYEMPSSQCSPPTARPGTSNHELGLAMDLDNCRSRGTACYRWMAANASRFGFANLPAEPWHWSVDGT